VCEGERETERVTEIKKDKMNVRVCKRGEDEDSVCVCVCICMQEKE